jgi:hypothetical protein
MLQSVTFWALTATCTRVSIRTIMFVAELLDSLKRIGMNVDWSEDLDRLGQKLQTMAA